MISQNTIRVKPSKPPSGTRISLAAIDKAYSFFTPLNLFFEPRSSGPKQLQEFAASLQEVLDRLPLIAGSVQDVEDAQGVKSKELVDDGRGADLIWVESPIEYADLLNSADMTPRSILGTQEPDETLIMVKFTKFTCGTLAMGISILHSLADCTSYVDLLMEWARVSRGDTKSDPLTITSWERHPGKFFPPPTLAAVPDERRLPTGATPPPPSPPTMMSSFLFTWESLRRLKKTCTHGDPDAWVSTGDCVGAVVWRALMTARKAVIEPRRDLNLYEPGDGRRRSKMHRDASRYFGNLVIPFVVTLSPSTLLEGSLASVASAFRRAIEEQLTETNCANILASFESVTAIDSGVAGAGISSWTTYPLVGEELDFGGGAPFWTSTGQFPAGVILILPQKDGYLASLMIETEWEHKLHTMDELLAYAKPVKSH